MARSRVKSLAPAATLTTALSLTADPAAAGEFRVEGARVYRHADSDNDILGLGHVAFRDRALHGAPPRLPVDVPPDEQHDRRHRIRGG